MDIYKELDALHKAVMERAPKDAVAFELFINNQGYEYSIKRRNPDQLKRDGIAMKNLADEWVTRLGDA